MLFYWFVVLSGEKISWHFMSCLWTFTSWNLVFDFGRNTSSFSEFIGYANSMDCHEISPEHSKVCWEILIFNVCFLWHPFMQSLSHFLSYSNFRHFVVNVFVTLPQPFGKTSANRICSGSCRCRGALSWNKRWACYKYMKLVSVIAYGKY